MPTIQTTYPGLYLEELPSGSRNIVGAPTAITAFLGRAPYGPVNKPTECDTFGDFQRYFGGLQYDCPMSYAVQDFFNNGGVQATIVRLFKTPDSTKLPEQYAAAFPFSGGAPPLTAANPGTWANLGPPVTAPAVQDGLQVVFDYYGLQQRQPMPAAAVVQIDVPNPSAVTGVETIEITVGPTSKPTYTLTPAHEAAPTQTALDIANDIATLINAAPPAGLTLVTVDPASTTTSANLIFTTVATGSAQNTSAANAVYVNAAVSPTGTTTVLVAAETAQPTATAPATFSTPGATASAPFLGGADATATPAQVEVVFAGTASVAQSFEFTIQGFRMSLDVPDGSTATQAAQLFAARVLEEFGGTGGLVASAAVDTTKNIVTLVLGLAGAGGNTVAITGLGSKNMTLTVTLQQVAPATGTATVPADTGTTAPATLTFAGGLDAGVNHALADRVAELYPGLGLVWSDFFNLTASLIVNGIVTKSERWTNLTVNGAQSPTRIDRVLNGSSALLAVITDEASSLPSSWTPYAVQYSYLGDDPTVYKPLAYYANADGSEKTAGQDSAPLTADTDFIGNQNNRTGMYALDHADVFNLLCIPPDSRYETGAAEIPVSTWAEAAAYCSSRKAMVIVDPPLAWATAAQAGNYNAIQPTVFGMSADEERQSAVFFPRVLEADPLMNDQLDVFVPCGAIAGMFATTDRSAGVWKAPAGIETALSGVSKLEVKMTDAQNGVINPLGINALRTFPVIGNIIWGARTLRGADALADDYKYIPVRRLTNYIELSLLGSLKWAVFEPNDETLWSQLRMEVGAFMAGLAQQGAFYGYNVQCDNKTTTAADIANGVCNILVAFAPVLPAEYIVIMIQQQTAAQLSS